MAAPGWAVAVAAVLLLAVLPGLTWRLASTRAPGDSVVSASLKSGQMRDIGQELTRVEIGRGCQMVHLRLEIVPPRHGSYSATLFNVTGDEIEILSQRQLAASSVQGKLTVMLTLPCELLREGDYYVRLEGASPGAAPVDLRKYAFRVLER